MAQQGWNKMALELVCRAVGASRLARVIFPVAEVMLIFLCLFQF